MATARFDIYTDRTWWYYPCMAIAIGTLLFILEAWNNGLKGWSPFTTLDNALVICGVITSLIFLFVLLPGVVKPISRMANLFWLQTVLCSMAKSFYLMKLKK